MVELYCNKIGIPQKSDMESIYNRLLPLIGSDGCDRLQMIMNGRYQGNGDAAIYKYMNEDLETSLAFFGGYDAGYLRKVFAEIEQYKEEFGKEILDVGCNNGIITCFIAKCCPDSHVIGMDYGWYGIDVAKKLKDYLGLTNVDFIQKDFMKLNKQSFDTIFMFKVIHEIENLQPQKWEQSRENLVKEFRLKFKDMAKRISKNLKQDGMLFSVERIPYIIATYGYCLALSDAGIQVDTQLFKRIEFCGVDQKEKMPLLIAHKKENVDKELNSVFNELLDIQDKEFYAAQKERNNDIPGL